jgi:hypothetical protein
MQSHPGHIVEMTFMGEESRKDFLGHVEYRYFCRGMERSDPTNTLHPMPVASIQVGSLCSLTAKTYISNLVARPITTATSAKRIKRKYASVQTRQGESTWLRQVWGR